MLRHLKSFSLPIFLATGILTSSFFDSDSCSKKDDLCGPRKCKDSGPFFTADGLIWQASEPDLTYATKTTPGSSLFDLGSGRAHNLNFKWEYGFRAGIVFRIPHGNWDTYLNYTWFQDRANNNTTDNGGNTVLYPNFLHSAIGNGTILPSTPGTIYVPTFVRASADWKLRLQILDWELGKKFYPSKWFAVRLHAGIRGTSIQQDYRIAYIDAISGADVLTGENIFVRMIDNYWGAGIRTGFDSEWFLSTHWSLYGNTAISLLWGPFNLRQTEEIAATEPELPATVLLSMRNNYNAGRAVTDLQLGLRWQTNFHDGKCSFALQAGWELHVFFEQNEFMHFNDVANTANFTQSHGNLSVQGGTLAARFDF